MSQQSLSLQSPLRVATPTAFVVAGIINCLCRRLDWRDLNATPLVDAAEVLFATHTCTPSCKKPAVSNPHDWRLCIRLLAPASDGSTKKTPPKRFGLLLLVVRCCGALPLFLGSIDRAIQ